MPPANSPDESPPPNTTTTPPATISPTTASASPYLEHLNRSTIASPVPDFAGSLLNRTAQRGRNTVSEAEVGDRAQDQAHFQSEREIEAERDMENISPATGTGRGTRRQSGTNATTHTSALSTEHQRIPETTRRPYLTDDAFLRIAFSSASAHNPTPTYNPDPNADPEAESTSPSNPTSGTESRQRLPHVTDGFRATAAVAEESMPVDFIGGSVRGPNQAVFSDLQRAYGERNARTSGRPAAAGERERRREWALARAEAGLTDPALEDLRDGDMDDEAENRLAAFRELSRAYMDANRRRTQADRERVMAEAHAVVERTRSGQRAMAGPTDREAMAHRRRLYDWAVGEGSDDDEEMNDNENDTDPEAEGDGWRDLEEALSTHIRRRNARSVEVERAEADIHRVEADMSRRLTERAARRREERIASLIDGSRGQSLRLRHRASRERNLRVMEEFVAERERRGGGLSREELRELEAEATRREIERRHGIQLHRSERVAEMLRERQSQRHANTRTRNMLEYLSRLRSCDPSNPDEAIALAMSLEIHVDVPRDQDFITDTTSIPAPAWSSLLTPGATFTGSQHAPHDAGVHLLSRDRDYLRRMVANRNLSSAHLPLPGSITALADAERLLLAHPHPSSQSQSQQHTSTSTSTARTSRPPDHWPVSVTLHSVDMTNMTLTGTMSANHIPDKMPPGSADHKPDGSSMMSFFEGEIVDFRRFALQTETYKSEGVEVDLQTDARYWAQLGGLREEGQWGVKEKDGLGMGKAEEGDKRLARCLGSKDWLRRVMGEWVFMRWKERTFIAPSPSDNATTTTTTATTTTNNNSWGLTISGFYYIAMKRDTGRIEGLYYDPGSQPYQRLDLVPVGSRERAVAGGGTEAQAEAGGVRKWFPSVEFGRD